MIRRLRIVWHVIRGRPLVYRTKFRGEVNFDGQNRNLLLAENIFRDREDETLSVIKARDEIAQKFNYEQLVEWRREHGMAIPDLPQL